MDKAVHNYVVNNPETTFLIDNAHSFYNKPILRKNLNDLPISEGRKTKNEKENFYTINNGGLLKRKGYLDKRATLWPPAHTSDTLSGQQRSVNMNMPQDTQDIFTERIASRDAYIDIFTQDEEKVKSIFDLNDLPISEGRKT